MSKFYNFIVSKHYHAVMQFGSRSGLTIWVQIIYGYPLFTWYDVCCNIRGGDYVLVVKFSGGDYVLVVKFMGGILSTYTKMSRRGFVRGGILSYTLMPVLSSQACFTHFDTRILNYKTFHSFWPPC